MKEKIKNKHAITLLALIITVIILLILATVSISLIINSGILEHAQHGVDKYSEEEELEQIKLAVASAMLKGNGFLETENLNAELQDRFQKGAEQIGNSKRWSLKLDKNYTIYENGNVEENESLLPAEYQQVEYIESSGTQYIDTKIVQNTNCGVYYDASIKYDNNTGIFGCCIREKEGFGLCQFSWQGEYVLCAMENKKTRVKYASKTIDDIWDNRHVFWLKNKNLYIDEEIINENSPEFIQNNGNCYFFWMSGGDMFKKSKQKLFLAKLYDENNNIIKQFIPCYSATTIVDVDGIEKPKDTIGMYDIVNGQFYVNQGTGTFGYETLDGTYVAPTNN